MAFWDKFKKKPRYDRGAKKTEPSPKEGSVKRAEAVKEKKGDTGPAYRILMRPVQSEKAAAISSHNQYVFEVAPGANKLQIKEAVLKVYGVRPSAVNIIRSRGKQVRYGAVMGRENVTKKAVVTLPAGKAISIYEGV